LKIKRKKLFGNIKRKEKKDSLSHVCKKKEREIDRHSKCANKRATEKKQE
jgi:hypothetical protein